MICICHENNSNYNLPIKIKKEIVSTLLLSFKKFIIYFSNTFQHKLIIGNHNMKLKSKHYQS